MQQASTKQACRSAAQLTNTLMAIKSNGEGTSTQTHGPFQRHYPLRFPYLPRELIAMQDHLQVCK